MSESDLNSFEHPARAYRLRYPADWEHQVHEKGRRCGFGPRDRDDVGLWISILPLSTDTDQLRDALRGFFEQSLEPAALESVREDPSLRHFGLRAESIHPEDGGSYWVMAGGDLVLFAASQLPASEREVWSGPFDRLMASLVITRDEELLARKVENDLLARLRERFPEQNFEYREGGIRGRDSIVFAGNLIQQVRKDPDRRDVLIEDFITGMAFTGDDAPSAESLDPVRELILPILKPASYIRGGEPAGGLAHRDWVGDVILCYAIRGNRTLRFVLQGDIERWGIDAGELHRIALENLERLPWPKRLKATGEPGERVAVVNSQDSFDASRLIDPRLHELFSPLLGSPFSAGIPDRGFLVLFSAGNPGLHDRIARQLEEDHRRAAYPISASIFQVGPDGIVVPVD